MAQTTPSSSTPSGTPGRALRFTIARDAAVLIIIAAVLEITLRLWDPRYRQHLFDAEFTGGFPIALNADGFRGPIVTRGKTAAEIRVLALGDSTTFGTGVAAGDTWPIRLGGLPRPDQRATTVVNAAEPGVSLKEITFEFNHRLSAYRPDVVVLAVSGNLVSRSWIDRTKAPAAPIRQTQGVESRTQHAKRVANRAIKQFCLPSFFSLNVERGLYHLGLLDHNINPNAPYGAIFAHGWRQVGLDPARVEEAWGVFEEDLRILQEAARRAGSRLVVTVLPSRFMLTDAFWDNEKAIPRNRLTIIPADRVRSICSKLGIEHVDSVAALRSRRREAAHSGESLYIQSDYTHLDQQGHAVVARAIAATPALR